MVLQRFNQQLALTAFLLVLLYLMWRWFRGRLSQSVDSALDVVTEPTGELLSDITAALNGHVPVELQPLIIQEHHITADYTLTPEAETVYWKIGGYQPLLYKLFGGVGRPMKTRYRHLIGEPITEAIL
ncbi:hypothetical protein BOO91_16880 [Vibrio navarrensis]|uniref:Uncharacterized protein n=1 Tax=Vibrio navarrensis TaxID=29495 RepID=A0AAJ4IFK7_9VIBR|nr:MULTISPECIES: hypothetical protein [Vibrio]ELV8627099.1 hypothetical protein [Vibrio cidicii]KJR21429.1 hypothetical protein UF06_21560 [Vibrio sp. S234-5]KYN81248.1 hypothetical protein ATY36_15785 [Vibrio cidicii]MBE3662614.1 hypothetical protein [Vibrio navarrensis]MBE4602581.1 hypothetical protein [Vibrio navarrensis]